MAKVAARDLRLLLVEVTTDDAGNTAYVQVVSNTAIGDPSDAAWNGTDANATVISLLKAIATNTAA